MSFCLVLPNWTTRVLKHLNPVAFSPVSVSPCLCVDLLCLAPRRPVPSAFFLFLAGLPSHNLATKQFDCMLDERVLCNAYGVILRVRSRSLFNNVGLLHDNAYVASAQAPKKIRELVCHASRCVLQ